MKDIFIGRIWIRRQRSAHRKKDCVAFWLLLITAL